MAEFNYTPEQLKQIKTGLRLDISRAPIELQLLWLFELLMIQAFIKLLSEHNDSITFNPETGVPRLAEKHYIRAFDSKYYECLGLLKHYRDSFVHKGFGAAIVTFDKINMRRMLLREVALSAQVTLNFENRMF